MLEMSEGRNKLLDELQKLQLEEVFTEQVLEMLYAGLASFCIKVRWLHAGTSGALNRHIRCSENDAL
jgi:hypothetical protein